MAKTINTNIDDGILNFTFTNNEGEVFSSFKLKILFRKPHQVKKWRS